MSVTAMEVTIIIATSIIGAIGFGAWMGHWGAGLVAFAVLNIAFRATA